MTEDLVNRLAPVMRQLRQVRDRKQFLEQALDSPFFPDDCRPGYSASLLREMESENRLVRSVVAEIQGQAFDEVPGHAPEVERPESGNELGLWTPHRYDRCLIMTQSPMRQALNDLVFSPSPWSSVKTSSFGDWPLDRLIERDPKEHANELLYGSPDSSGSPGPASGTDPQGD